MISKFTLIKTSLALLLFATLFSPTNILPASAGRLSNLIEKPTQVFMPSQLLPNTTAIFTLKAPAGKKATLFLSTQAKGYVLTNGIPLRVGTPVIEQTITIPESGVGIIEVSLPEQIGDPGLKRYVEVVLYTAEDMNDAIVADIINPKTGVAGDNAIAVGSPPEDLPLSVLPGDAKMAGMLRSLAAYNDASGDSRKKELLDDGKINTDGERQIDKTLILMPQDR